MRCVTDIMKEIWLQRRIVAHRGLHDDRVPENSAEAFRAAWAADLWCCECDVQRSADGAAVVLHDETLDRTTTGTGRVDEHPWSVLRHLNLRDRRGEPTAHRVPLLRDVLEDMPRERSLLVEVKPPDDRDLVRQAVELFRGQRARHVISFDERNVEHARAAEPVGLHALLVDQPTTASLDRGTLFNHGRLTDEQLEALSKRNGQFGLWTVNDDADVRRALSFRPSWIISDRPLRVREIQDAMTDDRPAIRDTAGSIE